MDRLLAWPADGGDLAETLHAVADAGTAMGSGAMVAIAHTGLTTLHLARGDYAAACRTARQVCEGDVMGVGARVLPDLVEAAVRSGDRPLARWALDALAAEVAARPTPWTRGALARSLALMASGPEAEALHREAIRRLAPLAAPADLGRAHLVYGEWLRRQKRRTEAREQLRAAHAVFTDLGAVAFAERAALELAATGERARKRSVDTALDLTPQEQRVARLAADGLTNGEIGERLFISARTVDYHLRKVYRKLGVASRRDLRHRLR